MGKFREKVSNTFIHQKTSFIVSDFAEIERLSNLEI